MHKKGIEQLTIIDDFMFGAVMKDPKKCKPLLEYILGIKIKHIEYPELQKAINKRYEKKSIRLDVYVMDDKNTVYNIEIQATRNKNLPKRSRYYQGMIDLDIIDKGADYSNLKRSFVIFICLHDPFGAGRYIYTFNNRCKEDDSIFLDDGTTKIFVNAEGKIGDINEELKGTLDYMAGKKPETEYAKELDKAVNEVKQSEEWKVEYMTLLMRDRENVKIGYYADKVGVVREGKDNLTEEMLVKLLKITNKQLDRIIYFIDKNPDWDDVEIAEAVIDEENESEDE